MLLQSSSFCLFSERLKLHSSESDSEFPLLKCNLNICESSLAKVVVIYGAFWDDLDQNFQIFNQ